MTSCSESQFHLEAAAIISSRSATSIGTWNVRTMYETGKTTQVATEMRYYNLSISGISESRRTGSGQRRLITGDLLLFSGHEQGDSSHTQGVALMLSRKAQNAQIGWEGHGSRIITATFLTKETRINMGVIQCYAPTNDGDEQDKEEFYSRLLTIIQDRPARNVIIVMGDFNVKIGSDNRGYEGVMGKQGLGEMNDNGERFANLCATSDVVKRGSFFQYRRIHKGTWVLPDLQTENQIDHMCIGKRFQRTLRDVRVRRGADVPSDHHLLVARLKLKLRRKWTERANQRLGYNTFLLNDTNKHKEFSITLSNKFQAMQELMEEKTIDVRWQRVKGAVTSTCHEVLGPRNPTTRDGSPRRH